MFLEQLLDFGEIGRHESFVGRHDVLVSTDGPKDHLWAGQIGHEVEARDKKYQ